MKEVWICPDDPFEPYSTVMVGKCSELNNKKNNRHSQLKNEERHKLAYIFCKSIDVEVFAVDELL